MSNTTITNIPSTLETRVKEPSDGAPPTTGIGGPSIDRFNMKEVIRKIFSTKLFLSIIKDQNSI